MIAWCQNHEQPVSGMTRIVAILFIGQIQQGPLGVHPHFDQLLAGNAAFLRFFQPLTGLSTNSNAPPTFKPKIVNEKIYARITSQHFVGELQILKTFQAANC
jgi:hypothetical protein